MATPSVHELETFKTFVAGNRFKEMENQSGALVMGLMGSGKSTTISIQLGAVYSTDEDGNMHLTHCRHWTPQTSDGWNSKTLQVSTFKDPESGLVFLDTAGLNENRGEVYKVWTQFSSCMVLSLLKSIQAVIVMINYNQAFEGRGDGFRNLAISLSQIVGTGDSNEPFYKSMIFVFTGAVNMNGRPMKMEQIIRKVNDFLESEKRTLNEERELLRQCYASSSYGSMLGAGTEIQWDLVPDEKKKELQTRATCIRVLQAILDSNREQRCIVSCLRDPQSCTSQRKAILQMIRSTPPITRPDLDQIIGMRVTNSSRVSDLLAGVITQFHASEAGNGPHSTIQSDDGDDDHHNHQEQDGWTYLSLVKQRAQYTQKLIDVCKRNEKSLKHIREGDWKSYRQSVQTDKMKDKQLKQTQTQSVKQEIQHLETSIKESVFETHEIREAKSSGFFSWTLFGGGWAERSFRLQGDWFSKYTLEGSHFSGNPDVDKGKGTIVANFISSHGHDLRVDVKTSRPEKDLPGSKQRVKVLREDLEKQEAELKCLQEDLNHLAAITSSDQLVDFVVQEKVDLERKLGETCYQLQRPIPSGDGLREEQVLQSLTDLLPLLLRTKNGVPQDVAPAIRRSMEDFVKGCTEVSKSRNFLQHDPLLEGITGQALEALNLKASNMEETTAPVLNLAEQAQAATAHAAREIFQMIDGWMISWLKSMETKPFAAGLSLLVVALLMPSSMVGWLFQLFLYFLGVFLVCSTMATNAHQATDFFGRIGLGCVEHFQLILGELPSKLQQGISGGIKGFSDKFDVKVRMNTEDFAKEEGGIWYQVCRLALSYMGAPSKVAASVTG